MLIIKEAMIHITKEIQWSLIMKQFLLIACLLPFIFVEILSKFELKTIHKISPTSICWLLFLISFSIQMATQLRSLPSRNQLNWSRERSSMKWNFPVKDFPIPLPAQEKIVRLINVVEFASSLDEQTREEIL